MKKHLVVLSVELTELKDEICQEDLAVMGLYALSDGPLKFIKQQLWDVRRKS